MGYVQFVFVVELFAVVVGDTVWPIPVSMNLEGSPVPLSSNFVIQSQNSSVLLNQAISRYASIIHQAGLKSAHEDVVDRDLDEIVDLEGSRDRTLELLLVSVISEDETLNSDTSYEYWIQVENMAASIVGQSVYGAIYGMETFSQLVVDGFLINSSVSVHDMPNYRHRGLMIDAGRRFFPVEFVYNLLDAMGYLKMNVLHFHLSDYCRFAVESKLFPSLTASLDNQYYKQDDIAAIVDYARQRGIRVMPEFDMPGHAKGLQPLAGKYIDFCSDNNNEIYGDPQHKSLESLQNLMAEMAALFPEPLFDIGCDETKELGDCTIEDIKNLEEELFNFIENDIEKTPVAYEEALFESKSSGRSVVIQAWESYRASDVVKKGNKAIEGNKFHFYLSLHPLVSLSAVWTDIAVNMTDDERRLLLGGEISFWTNDYCPSFQCGKNTRSHPQPPAYWMSDPGHDNVFSQSVGGMIWPRGIAAAGSFWNFNESLVTNSEEFLIKYQAQNQRLIDRGVISCPVHCTCDTLTKCGQPYPRNLDDVELQ